MEELPSEIKLVTLNCWGLKYGLSKLRAERLSEIGRQLASLDPPPHVVALQECWSEQEDYQVIRRETRAVLPYGKFYHAGLFGAGLVILSRWPIEESSMVQLPLSGRPTAFFRGDWYVGRGVACASIRFGPGPRHVLHVFNIHFYAGYREIRGGSWDSWDTNSCHTLSQAWEIAKLVRAAVERGHLAVAMGDFNITPTSPAYRLFTAHAPVRDAWRLLHPHPSSSLGSSAHQHQPPFSPSFNLSEHGVTSKSVLNTWSWSKTQRKELICPEMVPTRVPPDAVDDRARRTDYIFAGYAPPQNPSDAVWVLKDARVGMTKRHPQLDVSLSNHFSVDVTFELMKPEHPSRPPLVTAPNPFRSDDSLTVDDSAVHSGAFLQTSSPAASEFRVDISERHVLAVRSMDQQLGFPGSMYDDVLAMIHQYTRRERNQRHWRSLHFWLSLAVTAACLVAVCFSPHNYVAFILTLVAALGLAAGTVDGLLALLFFRQELRALSEFEWEVMNAKASAVGARGPSSSLAQIPDKSHISI